VIKTKFDTAKLNKTLNNVSNYSFGFLQGIEIEQINFNRFLGGYTAESLGYYIDSKARSNPKSFHHVYEWNKVGNKGARLFSFNVNATKNNISFLGKFIPSKSISENSSQPFVDKANIMENRIAITVEPKNSDVLVFEDDGELVFTASSVYIANPGGDEVAGSFGEVVDEFFSAYFTNSVLRPIMKDLENLKEFIDKFSQGAKSGKSVGVSAGRKYMTIKGVEQA
jgi:hypothetical protein